MTNSVILYSVCQEIYFYARIRNHVHVTRNPQYMTSMLICALLVNKCFSPCSHTIWSIINFDPIPGIEPNSN